MLDDEIDRLLSQAELRLEAARHLLKTGFCDDAVSRAYYSMYFAANAIVSYKRHPGEDPPGPCGQVRPRVREEGVDRGAFRPNFEDG